MKYFFLIMLTIPKNISPLYIITRQKDSANIYSIIHNSYIIGTAAWKYKKQNGLDMTPFFTSLHIIFWF